MRQQFYHGEQQPHALGEPELMRQGLEDHPAQAAQSAGVNYAKGAFLEGVDHVNNNGQTKNCTGGGPRRPPRRARVEDE